MWSVQLSGPLDKKQDQVQPLILIRNTKKGKMKAKLMFANPKAKSVELENTNMFWTQQFLSKVSKFKCIASYHVDSNCKG